MSAEPRWLNDDEQRLWRLMVAASAKLSRAVDETLSAESALSAAEYAVMVTLSEAPQMSLRMHELCTSLDWDRSRLSHQVTRMAKRGLVEKEPCLNDARGVVVTLTDHGVERLEAAVPGHVETVRSLVFDTTEGSDLQTVASFLEAIVDATPPQNRS